jgi:hypothetical protein
MIVMNLFKLESTQSMMSYDEYNVARYLDAFNKKLNLYWFVLMKMFVQQFY